MSCLTARFWLRSGGTQSGAIHLPVPLSPVFRYCFLLQLSCVLTTAKFLALENDVSEHILNLVGGSRSGDALFCCDLFQACRAQARWYADG